MSDNPTQNTPSENKTSPIWGLGLLLIAGIFIWQSCKPITCEQATEKLREAEREEDRVVNETTGGGTTLPTDRDSLTKGRIAASEVLEAREAKYEACKSSDD
jgi:hypothetical protein